MRPATLKLVQRRLAILAVGASTLRGQGAPGMVRVAREFLADLDLAQFAHRDRAHFEVALDRATDRLRRKFPRGGRHWGSARKVLNIFLRDATYDHFLRSAYRLGRVEAWLEVPLDGLVGRRLAAEANKDARLRWRTIKRLQPDESAQFQSVASEVARRHGVARVHLDLEFWR